MSVPALKRLDSPILVRNSVHSAASLDCFKTLAPRACCVMLRLASLVVHCSLVPYRFLLPRLSNPTMQQKYRENDALIYNPGEQAANHVSKHKQRNKALEIVFDPKDHKEYVTGFRKRKQQRRKDALKKLENRQRQQRLEERAERRQATKERMARLGIQPEGAISGSDDDEAAGTGEEQDDVKIYHSGQLTSTVTVTAIHNSDSEPDAQEGIDGEGSEGQAGPAGPQDGGGNEPRPPARQQGPHKHPQQQQQQQGQRRDGGGQGEQGQQHKKLSKNALRVMAKTKMKLEGKKGRGREAGFAKNLASKKKFKSSKKR